MMEAVLLFRPSVHSVIIILECKERVAENKQLACFSIATSAMVLDEMTGKVLKKGIASTLHFMMIKLCLTEAWSSTLVV